VAVIVEPGVGKSRLFWEFTHSHRTHGWLILETNSVSYGKASTYLPVIDLLRAYVGIEARHAARTLDVLKRMLLAKARCNPLLRAFEDLHWIDSETQALLDGLVESLPTARLLLLVNYRPEY
jgi:hypothetical protein